MTINQELIAYISKITKGLVTINDSQARKIVDIVHSGLNEEFIKISKFKYNAVSGSYESIQSFYSNKEKTLKTYEKVKNSLNIKMFYKFFIPELDFTIYTVNESLFE